MITLSSFHPIQLIDCTPQRGHASLEVLRVSVGLKCDEGAEGIYMDLSIAEANALREAISRVIDKGDFHALWRSETGQFAGDDPKNDDPSKPEAEQESWMAHLTSTSQKLPPFFRGDIITAKDGRAYRFEPEEMYAAWVDAETGQFANYGWPMIEGNRHG
ncbi:MAG: hypothetical protein H7Y60_09125 [Rhodospirillaceae bacterium]|nr:hypothetical protein [Rhodospirillales bacterium]